MLKIRYRLVYTVGLLFTSIICNAQQIFKGTVINKQSNKPVPFITVKLLKEQIAVSAAEDGSFQLTSNQHIDNDTLQFSSVGYITYKIPIRTFMPNSEVRIEEDTFFLNEIKVSSKKRRYKTSTLNDFFGPDIHYTQAHFDSYYQVARKFIGKKEFGKLKEIRLARYIDKKQKNIKTKFRLRVYDVNPATGGPGQDICHEVIEVQNDDNTFIETNVTKYNIVIPKKEFFIAVEWLYIPYNEYCGYNLIPVRNESVIIGYKEQYSTLFQPSLRQVPNDRDKRDRQTWLLDINQPWTNTWFRSWIGLTGELALSAKVDY
ncbi:hypothetical protein GCM10023149_31250 [Mucilaginibacter gynuensis]|uniref:Carboxypeptidase-like protein n=1 Tax=Mucilaginibacter gynuensis TaxID=1302236 RepID=A0ABP8GNQ8_9SPHI